METFDIDHVTRNTHSETNIALLTIVCTIVLRYVICMSTCAFVISPPTGYSEAVIEGVRKRVRVFVGDSIVRKTDRVLNKGDDVVVCLTGAKIEVITERVENIVGSGKGGSILVHVGTNNVEREGTTAIVRKYRNLVRTLKQVILSVILPVIGRRGHRY